VTATPPVVLVFFSPWFSWLPLSWPRGLSRSCLVVHRTSSNNQGDRRRKVQYILFCWNGGIMMGSVVRSSWVGPVFFFFFFPAVAAVAAAVDISFLGITFIWCLRVWCWFCFRLGCRCLCFGFRCALLLLVSILWWFCCRSSSSRMSIPPHDVTRDVPLHPRPPPSHRHPYPHDHQPSTHVFNFSCHHCSSKKGSK